MRSSMTAKLARASNPTMSSPKRPVISGEFSRSSTIICTQGKVKTDKENVPGTVKTITVETEKGRSKMPQKWQKAFCLAQFLMPQWPWILLSNNSSVWGLLRFLLFLIWKSYWVYHKVVKKVTGYLAHCATIVKEGRTFCRRMYSFRKATKGKRRVQLSENMKLYWWRFF